MTTRSDSPFTAVEVIEIALHEYNRLYDLVTFRMASLDRRAPIGAAALTAFLASVAVLPSSTQHVISVGLPLALVWFLRTTVNHARSFEDVLSRLAEIERWVNERVGEDLLLFQSRHPSRQVRVGGRTGSETVWSVYWICLILLSACAYLAVVGAVRNPFTWQEYCAYLIYIAFYLTHCVRQLSTYRYLMSESGPALPGKSAGDLNAIPDPAQDG